MCFFLQRIEVLLDVIGRDYKKMNRCDFAVAKEKFSNYQSSMFAMVKNGPYTRTFNQEYKLLNNALVVFAIILMV